MAHFEEQTGQPYDWNEGGVYVIEREDPVDGGLDGVSNRQGRELTQRTRDLHKRQANSEVGTPIAIEEAKNVAVGLAKGYTDQTAAAVRNELALGDQAAVNTAKAYADRIVAALVDGSPELLNTLEELAGALGNDPNFATTVMTEIGKRVKVEDLTSALAGKASAPMLKTSGDCNDWTDPGRHYYTIADHEASKIANRPCNIAFGLVYYANASGTQMAFNYQGGIYTRVNHWAAGWGAWRTIFHSGNFDPATKADKTYVDDGLGSKANTNHLGIATNRGWIDSTESFDLGGWLDQVSAGRPSTYCQGFTLRTGQFGGAIQITAGLLGDHFAIRSTNAESNADYRPWRKLWHDGNLKIIRGSVAADGRPAGGGFNSYKSGEVIYVDHNFGHTQFMAVATVYGTNPIHRDNVVTVIYKDNTKVGFQVTAGPDREVEWAPLDFIIMPY